MFVMFINKQMKSIELTILHNQRATMLDVDYLVEEDSGDFETDSYYDLELQSVKISGVELLKFLTADVREQVYQAALTYETGFNHRSNDVELDLNYKLNKMTKEELFKKYSIDESHAEWDNQIDNWYSVEVYRIMHDGNLPSGDDDSVDWITAFLDKQKDMKWWVKNVMSQPNWGSLYLTAKRMVYRYSDAILGAAANEY